jgi:hypothetical protein
LNLISTLLSTFCDSPAKQSLVPQKNAIQTTKKWPHFWGHVSRGYGLVGDVRKGGATDRSGGLNGSGSDARNRKE